MKLGSIGRSLMRYFKRPATQGTPKEPPPTHAELEALVNEIIADKLAMAGKAELEAAAIEREKKLVNAPTPPADVPAEVDSFIRKIIAEHGSKVEEVKVMRHRSDGTVEDVSSRYATGTPSADRAADHKQNNEPPDGGAREVPWQGWIRNADALARPGWVPCRFPVRHTADTGIFVNGIARSPFGLWLSPFPVCDDALDEQVLVPLVTVTHLRSGLAIDLFLTVEDAVVACEAATATVALDEWEQIDPHTSTTWGDLLTRTIAAWQFQGICVSSTRHAHERSDGSHLKIYERQDPGANKPETLS